jgi:hypothetical protein
MKYTYEEVLDLEGQIKPDVIRRIEDDAIIPKDEANSDYQAYLNKDKPQTPMVIDETSTK